MKTTFRIGEKVRIVGGVIRHLDGTIVDISPVGTYQVRTSDGFRCWRKESDLSSERVGKDEQK